MFYLRRTLIILFIIAIVGMGLFLTGINLYTDWLWFLNLNVEQVFLTILMTKIWLRLAVGSIFAVFIYINLLFTRKKVYQFIKSFGMSPIRVVGEAYEEPIKWLTKGKLNLIFLIISIVLGFFSSSISTGAWEIVLKYINRTPFGVSDPIFNKDIGFYVFELPFLQLAYSLLAGLVILTGIIVAVIYFLINLRTNGGGYRFNLSEKLHLSALAVLFFGLKAFGYRLEMFKLLYSPRGVVFGASYTDYHVKLFALKVLMVIVGLLAIFTLINIFTRNMKLIYFGIGLWVLVSILLVGVYPEIVQKYRVEPNEIELEKPFIKHNINYTLKAYGLDKIEQRSFEVTNELTFDDIEEAEDIIENIRLWDWRPLQNTYSQLQEIRLYYDIEHVDIDRYVIDGVYRQVMIAPRELDKSKLEARAQTWVNRVLKFTHGMGVVMSPVNVVTPEGLPEFYIKNIPPVSTIDLKVTQPRIYYGEKTNDYVIVNSKGGEFDYTGATNYYDGKGGIPIKNFWRRLVFAFKYSTMKILLSGDITPESRIMFDRNIMTRVKKIAPFLKYDNDPYIVINDGKLYWIIDAYTITNMYPYSEPVRGWGNYVRNSVKAVVDAYHGTVNFYISDPDDPLIQTYAKIFPNLFKSLDQMPEGLKAHIRYPEDLFKLQSQVYATYHMKDPVTFFNKEDLWNIPKEKYAGQTLFVEPYYIITRLPGEEDLEFILIQPFTPARKNNMVSWLAAKSDGENYGKLVLYSFPKNRTIYGPMMIEARIDQDSEISQQLTLWDQKGSSVIRGNLLTIPIKNSILYVEPIFLQAQQSQLPELKRVIVVFGDEVVMEPTLREALAKIFGIKEGIVKEDNALDELGDIVIEELAPLAERALQVYQEAKRLLREGDFAGYGEKLNELESLLKRMRDLAQEETTEL
ncbi:hypothetical protein BBF96_04455 [Anoxybacter fermentans]|uniref:UPF0182 protein BBF96_04455 n=1 Tax=Anoxybacter fermentans TaxID=1323375 RepID=A0A3S9SWR5_9FIRM|nr:UPF0182 family protein [Anoxybacter fermentans]AZR72708.1 hypothetical protein BBF96_04455 [Anoxybacter fermentans]